MHESRCICQTPDWGEERIWWGKQSVWSHCQILGTLLGVALLCSSCFSISVSWNIGWLWSLMPQRLLYSFLPRFVVLHWFLYLKLIQEEIYSHYVYHSTATFAMEVRFTGSFFIISASTLATFYHRLRNVALKSSPPSIRCREWRKSNHRSPFSKKKK